jgi:hypothetical protein
MIETEIGVGTFIMIKDPRVPHDSENQERANHPSGQDRQEQYQRTREQAPRDQASGLPDSDNNLGRGAPADREERIRQRAHELWEAEGRPNGRAQQHWDQAAKDLENETSGS